MTDKELDGCLRALQHRIYTSQSVGIEQRFFNEICLGLTVFFGNKVRESWFSSSRPTHTTLGTTTMFTIINKNREVQCAESTGLELGWLLCPIVLRETKGETTRKSRQSYVAVTLQSHLICGIVMIHRERESGSNFPCTC